MSFTPRDPADPWPRRSIGDVLTSRKLVVPFCAGLVVVSCVYFLGKALLERAFQKPLEAKQRAWIMTLYSAVLMLSAAGPLAYEFVTLPANGTVADLPDLDSPYAWNVASFFLAYLVGDTVIGMVEFRSQFGFISGWVHHIGYAIVVITQLQMGQVGAYLAMGSVMEVSTVFLALGHINKAWRRDLAFGATFFLTRVLFHMYVVWHAYMTYRPSNYWMVPCIPLPLHMHWFYGWVKQQRKNMIKRVAVEKKEE